MSVRHNKAMEVSKLRPVWIHGLKKEAGGVSGLVS